VYVTEKRYTRCNQPSMNVYDAAENAQSRAENAVRRSTRHGHDGRGNVACAVARTYLEGVLNDDEQIDEALGITLRRLERESTAEVR